MFILVNMLLQMKSALISGHSSDLYYIYQAIHFRSFAKCLNINIQKRVLKTTNKTPAVIAQSAERWILDRKSRVRGLLCKRSLWARWKIRCECNVQHVSVQITHLGLGKRRRHHARGGSNLWCHVTGLPLGVNPRP